MKTLLILSASASSVQAYGLAAAIALLAFIYLVYVLIKPEKF